MDINFKTKNDEFSLDLRDMGGLQLSVIEKVLEDEDVFSLFEKDLNFTKNELLKKINIFLLSSEKVELKTMSVSKSCLAANILVDYDKYGSRLFSYFLNSSFSKEAFIDEEYSKVFCDNMILFFEKFGYLYKKKRSIVNLLAGDVLEEDISYIADNYISFLKNNYGNKIIIYNDFDLNENIDLYKLKEVDGWEKILSHAACEVDSFEDIGEWLRDNLEDSEFVFNVIWDKNYNENKKFIFSGKEFFDGGVNLLSFLKNYN